ncbi:ABC transporter ATP-binding protein [Niallia sp. Krafla_26]|uniref:ABC transporter ATP-binding protein n=1 Tax=Niallia sp. Krafla_26 TaxID=3064703 RepID=UPI003D173D30
MKIKDKTSTFNAYHFWQLLKETSFPKWILVVACILSLLETAAGLFVPILTMSLVDGLADASLEVSIILLLAFTFLIQTISSGFSFFFMAFMGESVVASIRQRLWKKILRLPVSYFDEHQSGDTMSRMTQDTNTVKDLITSHFITFITGMISVVGSVILLFMIDWKMTLIMIISVPLAILVIFPLGQKMYKISLNTQDELANFSGDLGRVLTDIRLVKAYHAEESEMKNGKKRIRQLFQYGLKEAKVLAVISPFMTFVMMLVLVILIGYGGVQVASGALTAGALVAIIIYMFQIVVPFTQLASFFTAFQKAIGATERIQGILRIDEESSQDQFCVVNPVQNIEYRQLTFSYHDTPIIKDVNLQIPYGKTTAFVGPSGSGKTTLFSLLERFYQPDKGYILLGDINIAQFDLKSWRSQIGYVSQESPLMSGSIKDNIIYGIDRTVTDEELKQAAIFAHAFDFIQNLPQGFDTEVGERGVKLSGGQRQRIAIARALIRDPHILLLDEATSNLDSESELLVQLALKKLMAGRTTLIIAHRLSTIMDADQIVVLEAGTITGSGTHEELVESHDFYQKLAKKLRADIPHQINL